MMRKLLYSFLFFISSKSFSKRSFTPSLGLLCVGMFFVSNIISGQTWTGSISSDWSTAGNWSGNAVPNTNANIIIGTANFYPILTSNRTCRSITFRGSNLSLTVNSGFTLNLTGGTGAVVVESSNSSERNVLITGGGTLACESFTVGSTSAPNSDSRPTGVVSTISNLNISGNLTIISSTNGSNTNNATFYLESGVVNLGGRFITNNGANNISTFTTASGAQSGTLVLSYSGVNPFSLSGTGSSLTNFTGSSSTVNYSRSNNQDVRTTIYNNLILSGSGTKTLLANTTINNTISIESGVVANLGTSLIHTANKIILGGVDRLSGSWGHTTSAATNKDGAFFSAVNGIINVSDTNCPLVFTMTGTSGGYCSTAAGTPIGLSGSEIGATYQLYSGTTTVGSSVPGTGSALTFGTFKTTGDYTIVASKSSTLCKRTFGPISIYNYSTPPTPTATVVKTTCPTSADGSITITNAVTPASLAFTSANNQYVNLVGSNLLSNRATFTIEGWVKFDRATAIAANRMSLFGQNDAVEIGFINGNLMCWTANGGQVDMPLTDANYPNDNGWHHIAVTADGTANGIKIFVDGSQKVAGGGAVTNYGSNTDYTTKFGWGTLDATGGGFTGQVFKLGFWSRALSPTEVTRMASGFVVYNASQTGLLAGYNFNEGTGSTVAAVGNPAPSGTLVASPTWTDPYSYSWTSTPAGFTATTKNITNLTARTYTLVTSLKGCTNTGFWDVASTNPTLTASVSIAASPSGAICAGTSVTFTATPTNPGIAPSYQWKVNGGNVGTGASYSSSTLSNNDVVTCVMISNASPCLTGSPATSNPITMTVNLIPTTPSITKNNDASCSSLGRITITGLSGNWTIYQTGDMGARPFNGTSSNFSIQDLTVGTHYFTVKNSTTGCTSGIATVKINDTTVDTEWDGSGWTNGVPDGNKRVTISSIGSTQPFSALAQTNIDACSLIITAGSDVIIPSGVTLTVTNAINSNGKLVFESGSSLLQGKDAVNIGDIVYKREVNLSRYDVVYWSMPVTKAGFTMHDFSPNTLYDKYFYWDELNGKWVYDINGKEPMRVGEGYNIRAPQDHSITSPSIFTGVFTGVPNNGDIDVAVEPNKWNFLGNPYPSAVDASDLILDTNKDVLGALYFWTHSQAPQIIPGTNTYRYISSDYIVYNGVGSIRVNNPSGPTNEFKGNIAAGQGFFAMPTVSQIKFNNDLRKGSSENTQFYKTAKTKKIEKNRLWLNATNSQGAFKQMLIGYMEGATNDIDISYDAITMGSNSYVDLYSINNTKRLTIQGRALPFDNTEVIPLGFKCGVDASGDRNFTISIDHADGFFATQEVYLEDKALGIITDLRKENYTFTSGTGTYSNRFALRYTNKALGNDDFENLENNVLVSVKDKIINVISSKETIKEISVYNIGAELIYSNTKVNASELQIKNLHSSDQVLLVNITLENGHAFTKKIIFSNL